MTRPPTILALRCPECGYGVDVLRHSWTESCPLRSNCPECGGVVEWADLLGSASPVRALRTLPGVQGKVLRLAYMVLSAYFPAKVWKEAKRLGRERPGRSLLIGVVGGLLSYFLLAAAFSKVVFLLDLYERYLQSRSGQYGRYSWGSVGMFGGVLGIMNMGSWLISPWVVLGILLFFVNPLVILAFPSLANRPDWGKVWRVWAYSLVALPLALAAFPIINLLERYGYFTTNYGPFIGVHARNFDAVQGVVTVCIATLCLTIWWRYAMRDYFALERSWARAAGLVLVAVLVCAVLAVALYIALVSL